jgi:uncharacterized repeat protein (TIGR01451 family)
MCKDKSWLASCLTVALVGIVFVNISLAGQTAEKKTLFSTVWPTFQETRPIPEAREELAAASVRVGEHDFIYVVGGQDTSETVVNSVFYAKVLTPGQVDNWETRNNAFKAGFKYPALVSIQNRLYVLGGKDGTRYSVGSVYQTQPQPGTGDTTWSPVASSLPVSVYLHAAVSLGDRIYVIGGYHRQPSATFAVPDVFSAIVSGSGELSGWGPESSLIRLAPNGISAHTAVASQNHRCIYVIGGWLGLYDSGRPHNRVFRACVQGTGKLGAWEVEPEALPLIPASADGIYYHSAAIIDDRVFVIGGAVYKSGSIEPTDSIYAGHIDASGHLGDWTACAHCLPGNLERQGVTAASNGTLYIIGGRDRSRGSIYDGVLFTPLLDFEKHATPGDSVTYGDTINYTLRLTNLGVRDFRNLVITDTVGRNVSAAFEFHSLPTPECQVCSGVTNTFTCTIPSLGLGETRDLNFGVTVSRATPLVLSAPASVQAPLAASTSHITWTQGCAAARLEVLGVGISDPLTNTLYISNPETIISGSIRAQATFKTGPGEKPDEVTFCSGGDCYRLTEPTSVSTSTAVYEQDVRVSGAISVTFKSTGDVQASALTAYFLRGAKEPYNLVGHTMNRSLYHETYPYVLKLPPPAHNGTVIVKAIVTDNNDPNRVISLRVQAGGVSWGISFTTPNRGNYLDIREIQLSGVPTTTNEVTVVAESPPSNGESFGLVGLTAEASAAECPLYVLNEAQVCENVSAGPWCWYTAYFNTDLRVYLPVVFKNSS